MSSMPKVGIMMPVYNTAKYLKEAIISCMDQTYGNLVLGIVDDGSMDGSQKIITDFKVSFPNTIRMHVQEHQGCPAARNACLELLKDCDIIARQDSDDTQSTSRIKESVDYLLTHTDERIVTCYATEVDEAGVFIKSLLHQMDSQQYLYGKGGNPVNASIVCWRDVYDTVGGFDTNYPGASDGEWNIRALTITQQPWGILTEQLYTYRRHPSQVTSQHPVANIQNDALRAHGYLK